MDLPYILVADDDHDLLEMVGVVLEGAGFRAACIADEKLLYDSLKSERPDLILMDIYLGAADGRHLCLQLKNDPLYNDIPIILYSAGHITALSIQQSLADAFVVKPFDIDVIIKKIHFFINRKKIA